MLLTCDYCRSACAETAVKCESCGAPLDHAAPADYRVCPHCSRRLLSLGSPTCNHCGRVLPAKYMKAREAALRRIRDPGSLADPKRPADSEDDPGLVRRILSGIGFDDGTDSF